MIAIAWQPLARRVAARDWLVVDRRRRAWERMVRRRIAAQFVRDGRAVVAAYRAGRSVDDAIRRSRADWERLYRQLYLAVARAFAASMLRRLRTTTIAHKQDEEDGPLLSLVERRVVQYLRTVAGTKVTRVTETTRELVRQILSLALSLGWTLDDTARHLTALYDGFAIWRAERIARTETVAAANLGAHEGAAASGLDLVKVWIATRDDRTRDSHLAVDETTAEMDEPFRLAAPDGGLDELLFPGDSSLGASAGNLINCRCAVGYHPRG